MQLHANYQFKDGFEFFFRNSAQGSARLRDNYHFHDEYEIFLVLSGYVEYCVEAEILSLGPKDFVIIDANLFHGKTAVKSKNVSYATIYLGEEFFSKNNCLNYKKIFSKSQKKHQYKISKEICENSGFYNAYERLKLYSEDFADMSKPIVTNTLAEMLYILNNHTTFSDEQTEDTDMKKILSFINDNYTENISLDSIASGCYLSKYYMCKIFKEHTDYSIGRYIILKRLEHVGKLVQSGKSITNACFEAGFSDYSVFYKAFLNEYKTSPRKFYKSFLK